MLGALGTDPYTLPSFWVRYIWRSDTNPGIKPVDEVPGLGTTGGEDFNILPKISKGTIDRYGSRVLGKLGAGRDTLPIFGCDGCVLK